MNRLLSYPTWRIVIAALSIVIAALLIFATGISVGMHRARRLQGWCESFGRGFQGRQRFFPGAPLEQHVLWNSYSVFGRVVSASGTEMIVHRQDDTEQEVVITTSTSIRGGGGGGTAADLKPDMDVAIFGAPNDDGRITAKLIRILPFRPQTPPLQRPPAER